MHPQTGLGRYLTQPRSLLGQHLADTRRAWHFERLVCFIRPSRFFIESSGGDVQAAIATYYESEGQEAGDEEDQQGGDSTVVPPTATGEHGDRHSLGV